MATLARQPSVQGVGNGRSLQPSREYASYATNHRVPLSTAAHTGGMFASPTESEFSEAYDGLDSVRNWDEKRVCEWLRSIGCSTYEQTFKANHVNGSCLIECDQEVLKTELGIRKIGDRVRIFVGIKKLRSTIPNQRRRNRDSIAALDSRALETPTSGISPRHITQARERTNGSTGLGRKYSPPRAAFSPRSLSPPGVGYASNPTSAKTLTGRPETPSGAQSRNGSLGARSNISPSMDSTMGKLPNGLIRVIYGESTKTIDIKGCPTAEAVMKATLRKLGFDPGLAKNHCFYVTDVDDDLDHCRCHRLSDMELTDVCSKDGFARNRLILRKIHAGEPTDEELRISMDIAMDELTTSHKQAVAKNSTRNILKMQQLTGESLSAFQYPRSPYLANSSAAAAISPIPAMTYNGGAAPGAAKDRKRDLATNSASSSLPSPRRTTSARPTPQMKQLAGGRPPSEFITSELTTYFPNHGAEEIERTMTTAQRRSARLSKALSRMSIASNYSVKDIMKDAPALPTIPDAWLAGGAPSRSSRPLSVANLASARFSMLSVSQLQSLPEESPTEPDRKSYVSFDNSSETAINVTDPDGVSRKSYFGEDESGSASTTEAGDSLNYEQCRTALAEDGEGPDEVLDEFLKGGRFDKISWMQGTLIGQGSFGSVYLALHAVTGELMAVKQVTIPSKTNVDKHKDAMAIALKHEIDLLRDLQHPHIVQYLGAQATDEHFNIFLEYVPGGSVASMLTTYGQLKEPLISSFVRQILDGLVYLHGRDIIHRDIKGANVLVDTKGKVKISDFGISKKVDLAAKPGVNNRVSFQGSIFWMAPEVVKQRSHTKKADIWSLGCLIVEMFTGEHPFPNFNQMQAIFQIGNQSAKPTTPANASEEAQEFLRRTFEVDENLRPEALELSASPFLRPAA